MEIFSGNMCDTSYRYASIDDVEFMVGGDGEKFLDKFKEVSDDLLIRLSLVNWININDRKKSFIVVKKSHVPTYQRWLEMVEIKIIDISDSYPDGYVSITYDAPELPEGFGMDNEYLGYRAGQDYIDLHMTDYNVAKYIANRH